MTLNVATTGDRRNPAVILLHGFPESHRTWREVAPRLEGDFFLVMPDQRGFAGSDLPQDVDEYKTDILIDDIFALADCARVSSNSRSSATTGAARSPGGRHCAATLA